MHLCDEPANFDTALENTSSIIEAPTQIATEIPTHSTLSQLVTRTTKSNKKPTRISDFIAKLSGHLQ